MSNIGKALEFLIGDIDKAKEQWTDGRQFESLLQRNDKSLDELIKEFDYEPDESDWSQEYGDQKRTSKMKLFRRRLAFLKSSVKEFREEYDEDLTDVDYMRLLEVPFTDSKYIVESSIEEMQDK